MTFGTIFLFVVIYVVGLWALFHITATLRQAGALTPDHKSKTANRMIGVLLGWAVLANAYAVVLPKSHPQQIFSLWHQWWPSRYWAR